MSIDQAILALQDAKNRGITNITVIINSSIDKFYQVPILEMSVSDMTGCVFYIQNHHKNYIGYVGSRCKS